MNTDYTKTGLKRKRWKFVWFRLSWEHVSEYQYKTYTYFDVGCGIRECVEEVFWSERDNLDSMAHGPFKKERR